MAGVLGGFYTSYVKNLAVLDVLYTDKKAKERIERLEATNRYLLEVSREYASGVSLSDWKRRLPADTKLAFSFLGFRMRPGAQAFTFRLGYEVAEAALSAKKGPTDYLSSMIRSLGVKDLAFVCEFASSASIENHSLHLHGVGVFPPDLPIESIQELLAPKQNLKLVRPVKGYRQRGNNKAIALSDLRTPGSWALYSSKEIFFTAHRLRSNPDYAGRIATKDGRELYESLRVWLNS